MQAGFTQQAAGSGPLASTASGSHGEKKKKSTVSQSTQQQQEQSESQFYVNKQKSKELHSPSPDNKFTSTVNSTASHGEGISTVSSSDTTCTVRVKQINAQCNSDSSDTATGQGNRHSSDERVKCSNETGARELVSKQQQVDNNDKCVDSEEDVPLGEAVVPETSYSSSDDCDDEYYDVRSDADDDDNGSTVDGAMSRRRSLHCTSSHSSTPVNQSGKYVGTASTSQVKEEGDTSSSLIVSDSSHSPCKLSPGYDYDALYDDDEEELGPLDGHGSVISHLISQVKIGMDLTKVVLPTFILERRSLLEMYADFFAHPDLFVAIADGVTAEDRFISVVRWYLSAFHAGRKSSVAKKPYNPVLGEVFKCSWDIPGYVDVSKKNGTSVSSHEVSSSPPPSMQNTAEGENAKNVTSQHNDSHYVSPANLTFIAEQVSHHPPVSAFYAEHAAKRIQCTGHIYTKSAFLGLSIGVHNIGRGAIYLLDHGEEYTVTFPSAFGRSILSVPWIELGGSVTISCQQTNYSANVTFQTKVSLCSHIFIFSLIHLMLSPGAHASLSLFIHLFTRLLSLGARLPSLTALHSPVSCGAKLSIDPLMHSPSHCLYIRCDANSSSFF